MKNYNYHQEMMQAVKDFYNDHVDDYVGLDKDDLAIQLRQDCMDSDAVTGNASGSHTFNAETAKMCVLDNIELLAYATDDYEEVGRWIVEREWETADVAIRCYLIEEVVDKFVNDIRYYTIDYSDGSGSGCDERFATAWEAADHMKMWTEKEREGCAIYEMNLNDEVLDCFTFEEALEK